MHTHTGQLSGLSSLLPPWVPGLELKSSVTAVSAFILRAISTAQAFLPYQTMSELTPLMPLSWDRYTLLPHYYTSHI